MVGGCAGVGPSGCGGIVYPDASLCALGLHSHLVLELHVMIDL